MAAGFGRHGMPPPLTLTFDRLTLKLVSESHLRWGTFLPNLGTLDLWVLELFATFLASVAALSALVLSPLRAQQFGILCLTVCVIQLLGLISFDVT